MEAGRSLDASNFGVILHGSGAFSADESSSTHTGHTLEPAMLLRVSSKRRFCHGFVSVSIEAQQHLCSAGLHPSTPPFHHTPWGLLSWQLDHTAITATRGYGIPHSLPGTPLMAIFTTKVPSSQSPQGCLAWAWPAHPFDS